MNGKKARRGRWLPIPPPTEPALELRWGNGRWIRLEDASARSGLRGPTTHGFLDYCLMRGYVRAADGSTGMAYLGHTISSATRWKGGRHEPRRRRGP